MPAEVPAGKAAAADHREGVENAGADNAAVKTTRETNTLGALHLSHA